MKAKTMSLRLLDETLKLITEKGTSTSINLREISRRAGCTHTNTYNYFNNFEELKWEAFRQVMKLYSKAINNNLHAGLSGLKYFSQLTSNLLTFGLNNPGLYRFIGADPMNPESIPPDIIITVTSLKDYFIEVIYVLCNNQLPRSRAKEVGNILLTYIDGEILNTINGRYLPDETGKNNINSNVLRLFSLLTAKKHDGITLSNSGTGKNRYKFPELIKL